MHQTLLIAKWINSLSNMFEKRFWNNCHLDSMLSQDAYSLPKELENFQSLVSNTLADISTLALTKDNEFEKKQSNLYS